MTLSLTLSRREDGCKGKESSVLARPGPPLTPAAEAASHPQEPSNGVDRDRALRPYRVEQVWKNIIKRFCTV